MHSLVSRSTDRKKKFLILFAVVTMSITALAAPINAAPVAQSSTTDSGLGSVYFAPMSSKLSNNAKRDLDTIIAANPGVQKFNVVGFSQWAPWGTANSYERISMLRAASVTSYMKSKGVTVEILNESGGLPETGAKTSKARKATVFAVSKSNSSNSSEVASSPSPNPSNSASPQSCQPLVTVTNAQAGTWRLSDQCGAILMTSTRDLNNSNIFEFTATNATPFTLTGSQISSLTVPNGVTFKGSTTTLSLLNFNITGNVEMLESPGTNSSTYLDVLGNVQYLTSGSITFNSNFAFTEPVNDLCYALLGGTNGAWKEVGVLGYTGNLEFSGDVSTSPASAADQSNCIDKLLATTSGRVTTKGLQTNLFRNFYEYDKIDLTGKLNIIVTVSNDPLVATTIKYSNPGDSDSTPDYTTSLLGVTGVDRVGDVFTLNPQ